MEHACNTCVCIYIYTIRPTGLICLCVWVFKVPSYVLHARRAWHFFNMADSNDVVLWNMRVTCVYMYIYIILYNNKTYRFDLFVCGCLRCHHMCYTQDRRGIFNMADSARYM